MKQFLRWALIFPVLGFLLPGCQSASSAKVQVTVEDAWGRPSPADAVVSAFYMVIQNDGNNTDTLTGASTAICGAVEFHESSMSQDDVMSMHPIHGGKIEIPAGNQVKLEPGGLHMMCVQKQTAFVAGDKVSLTLQFEKAGEITIEVEIKEP